MPISDVLSSLSEIAPESFVQLYHDYLPQELQSKAGLYSLGAIAVATAVYAYYRKLTDPPPHLRHIPYISFTNFIDCAIINNSVQNYIHNTMPPILAKSNGVYLKPGFPGWCVMVSSPQAAKQILLRMDKFPRIKLIMGADGTVLNKYIGGPNIVCLNGHDWKRHRKIANPVFNRSMHVKLFGHLTQTMFNTIGETNGTVDMVDLFERWTLDAIGKAGFGFDFRALVDKNNKWVENYNNIKEGMTRLFFLIFPILDTKLLHLFPKRQALHEKLNEFLGMLDSIIDQKRRTIIKEDTNQEGDNGKDLLTLMIESEMSGEGALSDEELRSNLCIFFLAGHDTTAFSLAFAIYEMAVNQNIQDRAREEAIRILGDKPEDVLPDLEQTKEMEYINMVMKETLRMHNPVFNSTEHYASEDCEIDGVFIPKGTHIALDILSLHRNPTVWNDPHTFNPERFAPGGETDNQTHGNMSWLPFGAGARQCVGMNFSISEQRVALSMMLRKYKWHLPEDSIHKDVLQSRGIGFGLITAKDLNITFEKLY